MFIAVVRLLFHGQRACGPCQSGRRDARRHVCTPLHPRRPLPSRKFRSGPRRSLSRDSRSRYRCPGIASDRISQFFRRQGFDRAPLGRPRQFRVHEEHYTVPCALHTIRRSVISPPCMRPKEVSRCNYRIQRDLSNGRSSRYAFWDRSAPIFPRSAILWCHENFQSECNGRYGKGESVDELLSRRFSLFSCRSNGVLFLARKVPTEFDLYQAE